MAEHEAKYINAVSYWSSLYHVAYEMCQEAFQVGKHDDAKMFDAWEFVAVQYSLRVLWMRAELY